MGQLDHPIAAPSDRVRSKPVKQTLLIALPVALSLAACATDPYGAPPDAARRTMYGAGAGAVLGALVGSALGDPWSGAGIGAIAGGGAGALVPGTAFQGRQYYRDTRGYCYYVDRYGQPQYDGNTRC
jgi:uncharacterized protein YcfJ